MKTTQPINPTTVTPTFMELTDGISLVIGVMNPDKTEFYPFLGIDSEYGNEFRFDEHEAIQIDANIDEHWESSRSTDDIHALFENAKNDPKTTVSNVELYQHIRNA